MMSCEDPVEIITGCTDSEAENFNPNATESDNSCVYARDAFLGAFTGIINCGVLTMEPSDFTLSVTEGLVGNNDVIVEITETPTPFPIIDGFARNDSLIIPESMYQIEVLGELRDVTITGNAVFGANEDSIEGVISVSTVLSGVPLTDNCLFNASR